MGTEFRSRAAHRRGARKHARHPPQSRHESASGLEIVLAGMITDLSKVLPRLGSENKAGHALRLPTLFQQFGENPFAVETFAAI